MTNATPMPRKSAKETEIDHLLAEEFHCDPVFSACFAAACGLEFDSFQVIDVVPEPSLEGDGYGDPAGGGRHGRVPHRAADRGQDHGGPRPPGRRSAMQSMPDGCGAKAGTAWSQCLSHPVHITANGTAMR